MKLRPLLAVSLGLLLSASISPAQSWPWSKPEITASSRKDAMDKCMAEARAAADEAQADRAKAEANPELADRDNPNFYKDFRYPFLLDDEWETIEITQIFCRPQPYKNKKGYWYNRGYLEYIKRPTEKAFTVETTVEQVIVSYGYTWKQE